MSHNRVLLRSALRTLAPGAIEPHKDIWRDNHYLSIPPFDCRVVKETLARILNIHPDSRLLVPCGHAQSGGEVKIFTDLDL